MLKRLKQQNITILVSTPYMDEASLCDKIALIQAGKILSIETPENIVKAYPGNLFAVKSENIYKLLNDLHNYTNTLSCFAFGEYLHVSFKNVQSDIENESELMNYLKNNGHQNIELKSIEPTIEDCFIQLMGNNDRVKMEIR